MTRAPRCTSGLPGPATLTCISAGTGPRRTITHTINVALPDRAGSNTRPAGTRNGSAQLRGLIRPQPEIRSRRPVPRRCRRSALDSGPCGPGHQARQRADRPRRRQPRTAVHGKEAVPP
ncbi:hypothetical protein ACFPM0_30965 [Pseudonocardia sulfidoxydans]|uniref:hypothetical protein n=1 Tax=Pseudonocardia sulfidoxydans TaxID=54011 RepID=UPI00360DB9C6